MADFARGERFRELRETRHLSQERASHEIGVSTKTIRAWEKGSGIQWENAQAAGKFYGVDPEELVSREDGGDPIVGSPKSQLDRMEETLTELSAATFEEILPILGELYEAHEDRARQSQPSARTRRAS